MIIYPEVLMMERIKILESALEKIEKFGHSDGHARGYTCANIAEEALNESRSGIFRGRTEGSS